MSEPWIDKEGSIVFDLTSLSEVSKPPCEECGETMPHLCDLMPAYGCLRCGSMARLVRWLRPDGTIEPDCWFFSCVEHHKGTFISPFVEREDGTVALVEGCGHGLTQEQEDSNANSE